MKKYQVLLLIFIFTASCNSNSFIPHGIIKPPQMQQIFWDIIRGDILAQEIVKNDSTKNVKTESLAITEKVLLIHHTNKDKFEKSMSFYSKHPQLLKVIFDSIDARQTRKISMEQIGAGKNYIEIEKRKAVRNYHDSLHIIKTK